MSDSDGSSPGPQGNATPTQTTDGCGKLPQVMGPARKVLAYTGSKLNGSNWTQFEFAFTAHFRGQDMHSLLVTDTDDSKLNDACFALLVQGVEPSQYEHLYGMTRPREAWNALKSFHRAKNAQTVLLLTQEFRQARLQEGGALFDHLSRMS